MHVVTRVVERAHGLRTRALFRALREATIALAKRDDARIVHMSIQRTHVHLIVEAKHKTALARGMQSFLISAARQINRTLGRRGTVFGDRYHATVLTSPRHVRNCIAYVLNNWRKHGADRTRPSLLDPFSSAIAFGGWTELELRDTLFRAPPTYDGLIVWLPKTWLLATGWRTRGRISARERPGAGDE